MSNHSFLPPSGAHSWSKCAMWARMNQQFPQEDSEATIEGTAAHWVAWEILAGHKMEEGAKTPNGLIVTEEMIEGGELLADTINSKEGYIETTIPIYSIHPQCFGTPDFFTSDKGHITIVDYKFGHRFVDEFWNPQGLCYLAGILDQLRNSPSIKTASFTVVQPRCYYKGRPVRTHIFTINEARPYFNHLANMAEASTLSELTATTNEHCGDCPGRHACSALQQAAYSDAEFSTQRVPLTLSPIAAALELKLLMRAKERIEARVEGLKEQTLSNIRAGKNVRYFRAEPGFGRQQWTVPNPVVISFGKLSGVDLSKPGVLTPKQAEKAGVNPDIVKANSFTPSTGLRLVAENPTDVSRTFARLNEE